MKTSLNESGVIVVEGEIDIYSVGKFKEVVEQKIKTKDLTIQLDFSKLSYMDSTGIGTLIELRKETMLNDQTLIIENPQSNIKKLFQLTGVDRILEIKNKD